MESHDTVARVLGGVALLAAIATAFYTWSLSPYFNAQPTDLLFYYDAGNDLTEGKKPKDSYMTIRVDNHSSRPAHAVRIVLQPVGPITKLTCTEKHSVLEGPESTTILVDTIPGGGFVNLETVSTVEEYPDHGIVMGYKHAYIGRVYYVQTDFGYVNRDDKKCNEFVEPLAGDKEDKNPRNQNMFGQYP
jgi:hypothetical protein